MIEVSLAIASEELPVNALVNLFDNGGILTARLASAPSLPAHGYVREAFTAGATADVWHDGRIVGLTGLLPGLPYYLSTVPGQYTVEPGPQWVGFAASSSVLIFEVGQPGSVSIILAGTLSGDGYILREARYAQLGETVAYGETVVLDGPSARWVRTNATADATLKSIVGMALAAGVADDTVLIMHRGYIRDAAALGSGTPGAPLYFGETPGALIQTPPGNPASVTRVAGWRESDGFTVRFEPSPDRAVHV